MTNPKHARESKTKLKQPNLSPGMFESDRPPFTQLSAATLAMSEMVSFGLRYWLFWHTSAVRVLGSQLEMLPIAAAATATAQAAKPDHAR